MMRTRWIVTMLIAAIIVTGIIIASNVQASVTSRTQTAKPSPIYYPPGGAGITPRMQAATTNSGPTFTENDVRAYFSTYDFPAGPVAQGGHPQVLEVKFITAKEASNLMNGEAVGRPDNSIVCYVKLKGPFLLKHVHTLLPLKSDKTSEAGDIVFDGKTGNVLIWGVSLPK